MVHSWLAAERVRAALRDETDFVEKRMMGGVVFMVAGNMACGVFKDAVLIRVGRENYAAAMAEPHVRPLGSGGRRMSGFVLVDPPGCETEDALQRWLRQALAFVQTLPPKAT